MAFRLTALALDMLIFRAVLPATLVFTKNSSPHFSFQWYKNKAEFWAFLRWIWGLEPLSSLFSSFLINKTFLTSNSVILTFGLSTPTFWILAFRSSGCMDFGCVTTAVLLPFRWWQKWTLKSLLTDPEWRNWEANRFSRLRACSIMSK